MILLLVFLYIITSFVYVKADILTYTPKCNKIYYDYSLPSSICKRLSDKANSEIWKYNIKEYHIGQCDYYEKCDYYSTNTISYCTPKSNELPGGLCNQNSNCHSDYCLNWYCQGSTYNSICKQHIDCSKGLVCLSGKCLYPLKKNMTCETDYDCENNHGCLNNRCVAYYSLDIGEKSSSIKYCKSIIIVDGICSELYLLKENSNETVVSSDYNNLYEYKCGDYRLLNGCKYMLIVDKNQKNKEYYTLPCQCTSGDLYIKYCPRDSNNRFKELASRLFNSIDLKAHTLNRNSNKTISHIDLKSMYFPMLETVSDEIIEVITSTRYVILYLIGYIVVSIMLI